MKAASVMLVAAVTAVLAGCTASPTVPPGRFIAAKPATADLISRSTVDYKIEAEGKPTLLFCTTYHKSTDHACDLEHDLTIWRATKSGWEVFHSDSKPFADGCAWIRVATSSDGRKIWALSHWSVEDPGDEINLVFSGDGGQTWRHLSTLQKPCCQYDLVDFTIDATGKGCVVFSSDDAAETPASRGRYIYRTSDGGKTWSAPEFMPNDLQDAQRVEGDQALAEVMKAVTAKH